MSVCRRYCMNGGKPAPQPRGHRHDGGRGFSGLTARPPPTTHVCLPAILCERRTTRPSASLAGIATTAGGFLRALIHRAPSSRCVRATIADRHMGKPAPTPRTNSECISLITPMVCSPGAPSAADGSRWQAGGSASASRGSAPGAPNPRSDSSEPLVRAVPCHSVPR